MIQRLKLRVHLRRARRQKTHQLCVKQITLGDAVADDAARNRFLAERVEQRGKVFTRLRRLIRIAVLLKRFEQTVARIHRVVLFDESRPHAVFDERLDFSVKHTIPLLQSIYDSKDSVKIHASSLGAV